MIKRRETKFTGGHLKNFAHILTALFLVLAFSGCSKKQSEKIEAPIISQIQVRDAEMPSLLRVEPVVHHFGDNSATASDSVKSATITFQKSEILGRDFLYGADVQYSSDADPGMDLYTQTMGVGHWITNFKIVGNKLQIIANLESRYESNVNHPSRLINEYPILLQDVDTVTVEVRAASGVLATIFSGDEAAVPRSSWVRSATYIANGNYLLLETSIETGNGVILEFTESLFPRETLVSKDYKPLFNDPDLEPLADRFRFLSSDPLFVDIPDEGRIETEVATRFNYHPKAEPIAWYVTSNIPAEYLPLIKMGVEGWNRYSQKMWGSDITVFKGVLPADVRIGDPRYNVIGWDSVQEAGAAYESQASDPLTGIQSHSLIYMPYAWINIGKEYWGRGEFSEKAKTKSQRLKAHLASAKLMDRSLAVPCYREVFENVSLRGHLNPEDFGKELLKATVLHEVGHALGLAHNFKGSLAFDAEKSDAVFSTSIMDYNQYQYEQFAFDALDSANGPVLEYDRQILSALYNDAKDIAESDSVLPACADRESDDRNQGNDPLCIRYDAGFDPTLTLERTIRLIDVPETTVYRTKSLAQALFDLVSLIPDGKELKDEAAVQAEISNFNAKVRGTIAFYYTSGAQSLSYMTRANIRSLYIHHEDVLPELYDASLMRQRVANALDYVLSQKALPAAVEENLANLNKDLYSWIQTTPYWQGLKEEDREVASAKLLKVTAKIAEDSKLSVLSKLRTSVLGALNFVSSSPFYFKTGDGAVDYEGFVLSHLQKAAVEKLGDTTRPIAERTAAAKSLMSFENTETGELAIENVRGVIEKQILTAANAVERQQLRSLMNILK